MRLRRTIKRPVRYEGVPDTDSSPRSDRNSRVDFGTERYSSPTDSDSSENPPQRASPSASRAQLQKPRECHRDSTVRSPPERDKAIVPTSDNGLSVSDGPAILQVSSVQDSQFEDRSHSMAGNGRSQNELRLDAINDAQTVQYQKNMKTMKELSERTEEEWFMQDMVTSEEDEGSGKERQPTPPKKTPTWRDLNVGHRMSIIDHLCETMDLADAYVFLDLGQEDQEEEHAKRVERSDLDKHEDEKIKACQEETHRRLMLPQGAGPKFSRVDFQGLLDTHLYGDLQEADWLSSTRDEHSMAQAYVANLELDPGIFEEWPSTALRQCERGFTSSESSTESNGIHRPSTSSHDLPQGNLPKRRGRPRKDTQSSNNPHDTVGNVQTKQSEPATMKPPGRFSNLATPTILPPSSQKSAPLKRKDGSRSLSPVKRKLARTSTGSYNAERMNPASSATASKPTLSLMSQPFVSDNTITVNRPFPAEKSGVLLPPKGFEHGSNSTTTRTNSTLPTFIDDRDTQKPVFLLHSGFKTPPPRQPQRNGKPEQQHKTSKLKSSLAARQSAVTPETMHDRFKIAPSGSNGAPATLAGGRPRSSQDRRETAKSSGHGSSPFTPPAQTDLVGDESSHSLDETTRDSRATAQHALLSVLQTSSSEQRSSDESGNSSLKKVGHLTSSPSAAQTSSSLKTMRTKTKRPTQEKSNGVSGGPVTPLSPPSGADYE
ncbi:MAG: hypothetical protein M1837_006878 [Sclerophora amabilis]|nr:MAG: hypothetical protein M1837_006878 [Sclerophora amabilis]